MMMKFNLVESNVVELWSFDYAMKQQTWPGETSHVTLLLQLFCCLCPSTLSGRHSSLAFPVDASLLTFRWLKMLGVSLGTSREAAAGN